MTATAHLPFWVPIVAPTLSNAHLASVLTGLSTNKLATLSTRFGFPELSVNSHGSAAINWLTLLGQIEDEALAKLVTARFKVLITTQLVTAIRKDLGISSFSTRKPKLDARIRELVGRYTANNIARGWGVGVNVIEAYRMLAQVEITTRASSQAPADATWKQEWIDLFACQTNAQIARATGKGAREVRAMRNTLRIAQPATRTYWKQVTDDEIAKLSDEQLCELYGGPLADYAAQRLAKELEDHRVASQITRKKRLPDQLTHFLSRMPLRRIAKLVAISEFHLKQQRNSLGIEPYTPFPLHFETLLSTCADSKVAEKAHTAVSTVRYRREKLRKPAYCPGRESV